MGDNILVYGTEWCPDCRRAKSVLKKSGVEYQWIDIDENPDEQDTVKKINNGMRIVPTIVFPDGDILVEPSNAALSEKLNNLSPA